MGMQPLRRMRDASPAYARICPEISVARISETHPAKRLGNCSPGRPEENGASQNSSDYINAFSHVL